MHSRPEGHGHCGQSLLCALDEAAELRALLERAGVRCGLWHQRSEEGWVKIDEESAEEGTAHRVTATAREVPSAGCAMDGEASGLHEVTERVCGATSTRRIQRRRRFSCSIFRVFRVFRG